jgi:hypothetical protein
MRGIMKAPTILVTPKFDVESSRRIVAEAGRTLTTDRKAQLQKFAVMAKRAYKK